MDAPEHPNQPQQPNPTPQTSAQAAVAQHTATLQDHLGYDGKLSKVYKVWIVNLILNIITLGIYRAWAKTNMRRYIYSSFYFLGKRFEYTGTGGEVFKGYLWVGMAYFLYAIFMIGVLSFVLDTLLGLPPGTGEAVAGVVFYPLIMLILYYGQFAALRYRIVRTTWSGIRGAVHGSAFKYALFRLKRLVFNIFTLGFLIGRSDIMARKKIVNNMYYGNQRFSLDIPNNTLDKINLITLLCAAILPIIFVILGGIWGFIAGSILFMFARTWYKAARIRAFLDGMKAGNIYFRGTHTGGGLATLYATNLLIVVCTIGFGMPIVLQRVVKYYASHTHVMGDIDAATVFQAEANANTLGEGIDEFSDGVAGADGGGFDFDLGFI